MEPQTFEDVPPAEYSINEESVPVDRFGIGECSGVVQDEELVERTLCGEEDAFGRLYEKYRRRVFVTVFRIILDSEETRDAMQEIFIKAYRSLSHWNPQRARFSTWLYRLSVNHAIDQWRIRRRRAELQLIGTPELLTSMSSLCWGAVRPLERSLERQEQALAVRRCVEELPQPQRRFFILRHYDGLKLREIAEQEGYKLGTVKTSLHRATKAMRRKLMLRSRQKGKCLVPAQCCS